MEALEAWLAVLAYVAVGFVAGYAVCHYRNDDDNTPDPPNVTEAYLYGNWREAW
jgi:hypothetical protein